MRRKKTPDNRVDEILRALKKAYPEPRLELDFKGPLECLVATMLSAQCTDAVVNKITPNLFKRYRTAGDYAGASLQTLERLLRPTGYYRAKARGLRECARALVEHHGGIVPRSLDALTSLPGVGRKTANVVLGAAFGKQSVAVDTHVKRVSLRLGLTRSKDPDQIEEDLKKVIPLRLRTCSTLRLILFGRRICTAKRPLCPECPLNPHCPWEGKTEQKGKNPKGRNPHFSPGFEAKR